LIIIIFFSKVVNYQVSSQESSWIKNQLGSSMLPWPEQVYHYFVFSVFDLHAFELLRRINCFLSIFLSALAQSRGVGHCSLYIDTENI